MTNRDLAERIVQAVMDADDIDGSAGWPTATDAVLDVLHETGHAFCRYAEDESGVTVFQAMDDDAERMEREAQQRAKEHQASLFEGASESS